ncbi:MAG TPA: hypothetical protein VHV77_15250 [Pirellulales bacterium]|jgi:hypothetical protein|nr:hypothetical protein [Pirellulales bacterium]
MLRTASGLFVALLLASVARADDDALDIRRYLPKDIPAGQACDVLAKYFFWFDAGDAVVKQCDEHMLRCEGSVDFVGKKGDILFLLKQNAKDPTKIDYEFRWPGDMDKGTKTYRVDGNTLILPESKNSAALHLRPFGDNEGIELEIVGTITIHLQFKQ